MYKYVLYVYILIIYIKLEFTFLVIGNALIFYFNITIPVQYSNFNYFLQIFMHVLIQTVENETSENVWAAVYYVHIDTM